MADGGVPGGWRVWEMYCDLIITIIIVWKSERTGMPGELASVIWSVERWVCRECGEGVGKVQR